MDEPDAGGAAAAHQDPRGRRRTHREGPAGVPAPAAARRDPQGARRGRRRRGAASTGPGWRTPSCPRRSTTPSTREIDRLERMSEQSPEHGWIRTWLDTVFELPWNVRTDDNLDLGDARTVLDADHTGLDDVKDRIVEHLAVRKLRAERGLTATEEGRQGRGHPAAGRPTGRRQDLARRVGRPCPGTQLRPGRPRWHPRRGRDPRSPPHLRRCPAGADRPGAQPRPGR